MDRTSVKTARFEEHRGHLRAVAYRMLGSVSDADDAVQDAWIRFDRSDTSDVRNLQAWLTTVVARISLTALRARQARHEQLPGPWMPQPVVSLGAAPDPEQAALIGDEVGLAMLVVLETLNPAERVAFVLHDVFDVPFDQIAELLERTPEAARQLASRARRRVRTAAPPTDITLREQRHVVAAFFAAGRSGDFERLLTVLHPDVRLRTGFGSVTGAAAVAGRARMFATPGRRVYPVTVNGAAGAVVTESGAPVCLMAFTVVAGRIATIDVVTEPQRLTGLEPTVLGPPLA